MITPGPTVWTVPIRLDQVGKGASRRLVPNGAHRAAIAEQLGLVELSGLEADVQVLPWGRDYEIKGSLKGVVVQTCGVTLEPFSTEIIANFSVKASENPPEEELDPDVEITLETPDPPDLIENGQIDLAAYVVEHLALEIDPFPRRPGAEFQPPAADPEPSPFAVLAQLRRDRTGE